MVFLFLFQFRHLERPRHHVHCLQINKSMTVLVDCKFLFLFSFCVWSLHSMSVCVRVLRWTNTETNAVESLIPFYHNRIYLEYHFRAVADGERFPIWFCGTVRPRADGPRFESIIDCFFCFKIAINFAHIWDIGKVEKGERDSPPTLAACANP